MSHASLQLFPLLLGLTTLLGFGLRLPLLDKYPFHADEAIYSVWARHAWVDPFFLTIWPDKPPLFLWLLAGVFRLFGASDVSARLLNIILSTLTIPVVAATARSLWGRRAAFLTACTLALNPFAISFAPTAFTDPLLVLAASLALLCAVRKRPLWAGLWLGVAIMTKQQGALYGPLILGALFTVHYPVPSLWSLVSRPSPLPTPHSLLPTPHSPLRYFTLGLMLVTLPILYWDSQRWAVAPSPWDLGLQHYGALTLVPMNQWVGRARDWGSLLWYLAASWWVWAIVAVGVGSLPGRYLKNLSTQIMPRRDPSADEHRFSPSDLREVLLHTPTIVALLAGWSCALIVLHIVTSVPPWDRYLLPLAPAWALLCGWLGMTVWRGRSSRQFAAACGVWLILLIAPAVDAAVGRLPIGGDHGAYAGLATVLDALKYAADEPIVLYHRVLGWHYRFYLYTEIERGAIELRWFPSDAYLADNALKMPHRRKFLIQPAWAPRPDMANHLAMQGLDVHERLRADQFRLLEVTSQREQCDGCVCLTPLHLTIWHVGAVRLQQCQ